MSMKNINKLLETQFSAVEIKQSETPPPPKNMTGGIKPHIPPFYVRPERDQVNPEQEEMEQSKLTSPPKNMTSGIKPHIPPFYVRPKGVQPNPEINELEQARPTPPPKNMTDGIKPHILPASTRPKEDEPNPALAGIPRQSNNRLIVMVGVLGFWLIFNSMGTFLWIQSNTRILALTLLAFTVIFGISNLFRFSSLIVTIMSILIYGIAVVSLNGVSSDVLLQTGIFSVGLIIASLLESAVAGESRNLNRQLDNSQNLIEEFRLFDPVTGLMRYHQALLLLKSEIIRSQRYGKNVCMLLIHIDNLDEVEKEHGLAGVEETKRQVVAALKGSIRTIDIPFGGEKFGVYLPETNLKGAKTVIDRLINAMVNTARIPASIGIAEFPNDGTSEIEIVQAAEAAMQVAATTEKSFVQYGQISKGM